MKFNALQARPRILDFKLSPCSECCMLSSGLFYTYPPMKMGQTECSETLACKIQTPGN